jgi:hypothetical protein
VYGLTHVVPAIVGLAARNEPKFWFATASGFGENPNATVEGCPVDALK